MLKLIVIIVLFKSLLFSSDSNCYGESSNEELVEIVASFKKGDAIICVDKTKNYIIEKFNKTRGTQVFVDDFDWAITNDQSKVVGIYSNKILYIKDCCLFNKIEEIKSKVE